jgi:Uma2 family endonuclease
MAVALQRLTLEEFLMLPEEEPALEFFEGLVTQKPWPGGWHSALRGAVMMHLHDFAKPRRLAMVFPELQVIFSGAAVVPDVAVYRWERIPRTPSGELAEDALEPPDVAVEIVSPDQSVTALVRKCLWYVEHGVPIVLL